MLGWQAYRLCLKLRSQVSATVKMAAAYLNKDKAGTPIRITYNTVTNNKVGDKASGPIENIVAMQTDNLYFASNKVTTTLLYNKTHEFESGTPGKHFFHKKLQTC